MTTGSAFAKPVPLFAALDDAALSEIKAAARTRAVEAGSSFFREGDRAEAFYVLDRGSVKLTQVTPEGASIRNPAFDVTPARYITAIVTERGVLRPPFDVALAAAAAS